MRFFLPLCLLSSVCAIPRDVVQFSGFKVNYNPQSHNNESSLHHLTQSIVDYMKNLGTKIATFFSGEEANTTTAAPTTELPPLPASTPATFWFGTHWNWPTQRKTTTPTTPIFWSSESQPGACPARVDAYVQVKDEALLFQGNKVYTIRDNSSVNSSSTLEKMFPDLKVSAVNAGLYNKDKELLILFSERSVWGLLWFESSRSWKVMDDYPKNLPESIQFTPQGAIRWIDDSQVLLSEDGRLAMYDEVLNEPLTTGTAHTYLKGLPEKIKGASRWTEKGAVRIFTETMVFEYDKINQKLEGMPLKRFLKCEE